MRTQTNRTAVITIAAELFLVRGFAATSMDDVVQHSGVSKSNIYYHFKSKDELAVAVLDQTIERLHSRFRIVVLNRTEPLPERLYAYTEWLIDDLTGRACVGGCPLMALLVEAGNTNIPLREHLTAFFQQQGHVFTTLLASAQQAATIRSDVPASALAAVLISWIEGSLMLGSIHRQGAVLRQERDALLHMLQPV